MEERVGPTTLEISYEDGLDISNDSKADSI